VASCGAAFADPETAWLQGDVIGQYKNMLRGDLVEPGGSLYGLTAEVHIGGGLQEHDLVSINGALTQKPLELDPVYLGVELLRKSVQGSIAHVMPGVPILAAGIAQAHDDVVAARGF
jgi:hypothetical protein